MSTLILPLINNKAVVGADVIENITLQVNYKNDPNIEFILCDYEDNLEVLFELSPESVIQLITYLKTIQKISREKKIEKDGEES